MNFESKIYIAGHRAPTFSPNIMSKSRMLLTGGGIQDDNYRSSLRNKLVAFYLTDSIEKYGSGFTLLTPSEVEQKAARRTVGFLQIKVQEYERLRTEIEELKREAGQETSPGNGDE